MKKRFVAIIIMTALMLPLLPGKAQSAGCVPFFNPITNVDWTVFIREFRFKGICYCATPVPRFGIKIRYAEPIALLETSSKPFFFPSFNINLNFLSGLYGVGNNTAHAGSTMHNHYVWYPVFWVIDVLTGILCMQVDPTWIDIAYMSELDPTWKFDELNFFIQPEKLLYANPVAQAICVADCIAATFQRPINALYWCNGCEGGIFPDSGNTQEQRSNDIAGRNLLNVRLLDKLHSSFVLWATNPGEAVGADDVPNPLCNPIPFPRILKSQYLLQPACPIVRFALKPGTMPVAYEFFAKAPGFEDYVNVLWRYRECCLL